MKIFQLLGQFFVMIFGGSKKTAPNSSEKKEAVHEEAPVTDTVVEVTEDEQPEEVEEVIEKPEVEQIFPPFVIADIVQHDFPRDQYYPKETTKNQVCLHHTVSGEGVNGDIGHWRRNATRVATSIITDHKGVHHQLFSTRYWGHHLGIKWLTFKNNKIELIYRKNSKGKNYVANNEILNESCHGIEIDNWGGLKKINGEWRAYPNEYGTEGKAVVIPDEEVIVYPDKFRGYEGFQRYTDDALDHVMSLLVYFHVKDGIPLTYNEDMWALSKRALSGEDGIWTHVSYRSDKSDCHPQPELIERLKKLEQLTAEEIALIYAG